MREKKHACESKRQDSDDIWAASKDLSEVMMALAQCPARAEDDKLTRACGESFPASGTRSTKPLQPEPKRC